jgi:hypothetical protein
MTDLPVTKASVENAIRNGMDWIVKSQITSKTDPFYGREWSNRKTFGGRRVAGLWTSGKNTSLGGPSRAHQDFDLHCA